MSHHLSRPPAILNRKRVELVPSRYRAEQDHRNGAGQIEQRIRIEVGGHRDDAIDTPPHRLHRRFYPVPVGVRSRDQQMKSVLLRGVVQAADHFGEELAIQIGKENAQRVGLAGDEAARSRMWDVAHPAGDFTNELPSVLAYWAT